MEKEFANLLESLAHWFCQNRKPIIPKEFVKIFKEHKELTNENIKRFTEYLDSTEGKKEFVKAIRKVKKEYEMQALDLAPFWISLVLIARA